MIGKLREIQWRKVLAEAARAARRVSLPVGFGLLVYGLTLSIVFPFERIGDYAEALASTADYDLEVGDVGPILGLGVALRDLKLANRPTGGGKPARLVIDELRVTTRPLRNLMGGLAYRIRGRALSGEVDIDIDADVQRGQGRVVLADIDLAELVGLMAALPLPVKGALSLTADLVVPGLETRDTTGEVSVGCMGCEVGDGKARLRVEDNPLLAEGVVVPRIRLGDVTGKVVFEEGVGRLLDVRGKSPDGEILIEGEIRLSEPLANSRLDLYVRFKVADVLLDSSDKIRLLLQFAEGQGKRDDGYFGVHLQGSLRSLNPPQWQKESPFATAGSGAGRPRSRAPRPRGAKADKI